MTRLTVSVASGLVLVASAAFADPADPVPTTNDPSKPTDQPITPPAPQPDQPPPITDQTTPHEQGSLGVIDDSHSEQRVSMYAWREPRLKTTIGIGFAVGGGVSQFTDGKMRDVVQDTFGGLWDARLSIGTHLPLGLDLSYVGWNASIKNLGGFENGSLLASTLEGAVRFNVLPHRALTPYAFAGVGWTRFDVRDTRFPTSDTGLKNRDDALELPLGAGLSYRGSDGFVGDFRGVFRAVRDPDLLLGPVGNPADLHTWEASASVGYEF